MQNQKIKTNLEFNSYKSDVKRYKSYNIFLAISLSLLNY